MSSKAKRAALKVAEALKVVKKNYDHALSELKTNVDDLEEQVLEIIKKMEKLPATLLQFALEMRNCSEAITKHYDNEHPLVLSATVDGFSNSLKDTFFELPRELETMWKETIMGPLYKWASLFLRLQERFDEFDTVRMQFSHYTRKVQGLSEEREKRKAKNKANSAKQEQQWDRNKEKLRVAQESFTAGRAKLIAQSNAVMATKEPRLNLLFSNVMQFQMQFSARAQAGLLPLKETLAATKSHIDGRSEQDEESTRAAMDMLNPKVAEAEAEAEGGRPDSARLSMSLGELPLDESPQEESGAKEPENATRAAPPPVPFSAPAPAPAAAPVDDPFDIPPITASPPPASPPQPRLFATTSYDTNFDDDSGDDDKGPPASTPPPLPANEPPSPVPASPPAAASSPPAASASPSSRPKRKGAFEWSDKYQLWFNPKNGFFFNEKKKLYTKNPTGNAWYRHDAVSKKLVRVNL